MKDLVESKKTVAINLAILMAVLGLVTSSSHGGNCPDGTAPITCPGNCKNIQCDGCGCTCSPDHIPVEVDAGADFVNLGSWYTSCEATDPGSGSPCGGSDKVVKVKQVSQSYKCEVCDATKTEPVTASPILIVTGHTCAGNV